jgi:hypothetical protein
MSSMMPSTTNNSEWRDRFSALNKVRVNSRQKYNDELIKDYESEYYKQMNEKRLRRKKIEYASASKD